MSTPDRSIENDKTLIGKNDRFRDRSLGSQGTITNENKRGKEFPEASHGMDLKSRYEIISSIGQGGMGHVYLAQDRTLARKVAIKRIKSHSDSTVRRFLVEARAIAQVTHYNIVQIFDYGHDADGPYLILEYVDGGTLADLLKAGPLKVDQSINITCRLAEGLVKAHELGIIHRDIKPANILMTKDGQPKLTDFGLARDEHTDSAHTVTGAILGTWDYMPPEQRRDATLTDARSDLWSLAATFYQMVTGKSPRTIKFNCLPSNLQEFVIKALEDDPPDRYQNAREFLIELSRKNIAPAIQMNPKGEIQTGECVSCHTINESNRKYCRKCAKPLRTNCLECEVDAPVWDNICGECGANQSESFQKKTLEYKNLITECNNLILNMELVKATNIVNQLIKLDKFRYGIFADQGIELKGKLETVEFEMQKKIEIAWLQALFFARNKDYELAIEEMQAIPANHMPDKYSEVLSDWMNSRFIIERLSLEINEGIARNQFSGLLKKTNDLIELAGEKTGYVILRDTVLKRNQELRDQINQLVDDSNNSRNEKNLQKAIDKLQKAETLLNQQILEDNQIEVSIVSGYDPKTLVQSVSRNKTLLAIEIEIKNLIFDINEKKGGYDQLQITKAIDLTGKYLDLNPGNDNIKKLHQSLLSRMKLVISKENLSEMRQKARKNKEHEDFLRSVVSELTLNLKPGTRELIYYKECELAFRWCPPGKFMMGSPYNENRNSNEAQVSVTLSKGFWMMETVVTQELYEAVIGVRLRWCERNGLGAKYPAYDVSWEMAVEFCKILSKEKFSKENFSNGASPNEMQVTLPTEAQWEYACRSGTQTTYSFGDDISRLNDYVVSKENSNKSCLVRHKNPNLWGLYGMHGNICEWTLDAYSDTLPGGVDPQIDGAIGSLHVSRGGGWRNVAANCRSAIRIRNLPSDRDNNLGFRIVLSPSR